MSKVRSEPLPDATESLGAEEFLAASFADIAEAMGSRGDMRLHASYRALSRQHTTQARMLRAQRSVLAALRARRTRD